MPTISRFEWHLVQLKPFSMINLKNPFSASISGNVRPALPSLPEVPLSGFGYPLSVVSFSNLEGFFQPSTLVGFTLQSFFPTGG
jgi:hypothetical protein